MEGAIAARENSTGSYASGNMGDAFGDMVNGVSGTSGDYNGGYGGQWGYYTDSTANLDLLGHRYYDQSTGRFINRDPIGYGGGEDLYGYTGDDPTGWADPEGFAAVPHWSPRDAPSVACAAVKGFQASLGFAWLLIPGAPEVEAGADVAEGGEGLVDLLEGGCFVAGTLVQMAE